MDRYPLEMCTQKKRNSVDAFGSVRRKSLDKLRVAQMQRVSIALDIHITRTMQFSMRGK